METVALVIQDLAGIEARYGEIFEATMMIQQALEHKRPEDVLTALAQRETLLHSLEEQWILLRQHEADLLTACGCGREEFNLSLLKRHLPKAEYHSLTLRLSRIEEVLVQVLAADEANQENSTLLQEGIKLELSRLQSVKTVIRAYGSFAGAEPRFIDKNR